MMRRARSSWLVTFMRHDVGYFDDETCRLEPIDNPFAPKVLPMSGMDRDGLAGPGAHATDGNDQGAIRLAA